MTLLHHSCKTKGDITRDDFATTIFLRNAAWQHCCDQVVSKGYNIVPTYQRCGALKIVVAIRPVQCNITLRAQANTQAPLKRGK